MDQEARALIERLRDDTQDREVFDRCNVVLAAWSDLDARAKINAAHPIHIIAPKSAHGIRPDDTVRLTAADVGRWVIGKPADISAMLQKQSDEIWMKILFDQQEITADEADIQIITGERK